MLKNSTSLQNRFSIQSEVERWVYASNDSTDFSLQHEKDDYETIDDSYLDNYDSDEKKIKINLKEQRQKVISILKQVRRKRESKSANSNKFNSIISNMLQANDLNKQEMSLSELKLDDKQQYEDEQQPVEKKPKKLIEQSKKFKSVNSNISRAMPGSLQQNITIERTFFKDLLKLSKQRYIAKLNSDFQKKRFQTIQARKGLCNNTEHESSPIIKSSFRSHSNLTQTILSNNINVKREIKSISAFAKRLDEPTVNINKKSIKLKSIDLDGDDDDDNDSNKEPNSIVRLDSRKRPNTTLALSHSHETGSSSRLSTHEVKIKLNDNKYYILNKKQPFMLTNPTNDERFKSLLSSMSTNKINSKSNTNLQQELQQLKPDVIVKNLIESNKALQRQGAPPKELDKRTSLIEMNTKLFEKLISNIN